jgi:hypothetical protein
MVLKLRWRHCYYYLIYDGLGWIEEGLILERKKLV